jgi:hypothetical protein
MCRACPLCLHKRRKTGHRGKSESGQERTWSARAPDTSHPWRCLVTASTIPRFAKKLRSASLVERVRWTNADPGCGMKKFVKLLCAAVLFGMVPTYVTREPQGPARSQDGPCKLGQMGRSSYRIKQEGEFWTYLLTASGPHWRDASPGRHGTGYLLCESCSSEPTESGGLYHLFSDPVPATAAERAEWRKARPATATERAQRREERVSYPYIGVGPENLEHLGSREGITLGALTGYAVLFRIIATPWVARQLPGSEGVLAIALTDGCVSFATNILLGSSGGRDPWFPLDSLLTEVTIEKKRGAPAAPPPPKQWWGDP